MTFALRTVENSPNDSNLIASLLRAPASLEILAQLARIDPFTLKSEERVDYLSALERQSAWLQSLLNRALVAVAGVEPQESENVFTSVDESQREEISSALRLSPGNAQIRIDVARTLTQHLPNVCSALAAGEISSAHASVIARESARALQSGIAPQALFELEQRSIAHAEFHTPAQVAGKVRMLIAQLAPEEFEQAQANAAECRKVTMFPESDGMATVVALLPAADAQALMLAVDKLARAHEGQDPHLTIDMRRADALARLAHSYLNESKSEQLNHRRAVTINLTIDLPTLLGMAENPGFLSGYGAIPASVARELAADGAWRRFVTDPINGNLLDYGRESYEPPQALVDFLLARDRTCRFPGCRQPSRLSDIDHAESWAEGGTTSAENLGLLCRRHHRLKTHGGWDLESFPDGSCTWRSPQGKKYFVPARPVNESV